MTQPEALPDDITPYENMEAVIACLGDDAAKLREANPDDEMADNMDEAALLLAAKMGRLQAQGALQAAPEPTFAAYYRSLHPTTYSEEAFKAAEAAWTARGAAPQAAIGATPEPPESFVLKLCPAHASVSGFSWRASYAPPLRERCPICEPQDGPASIGVPSDSPSGDLTESAAKSPEALGKRRCICCGGTGWED